MNRSLQNFRLWLCAALVLAPALTRAQSISDAYVSALGVSWVGAVNDPVVIIGSGFAPGNHAAITSVKFNGTAAGFSVSSDSQINVTGIPVGATTGLISVTRSNLTTAYSPQIFQVVGPGPYITSFSPVGGASTTVLLTGVRFNNVPGTNGVLFNGKKPIALLSQGQNAMQVITPPDVTTGPITIMASTGIIGINSTSSNFFGPSVITSFSPSAGRAGTNVVLHGTNFLGATSVLFNGLGSSYVVNNNNQITATVPVNATTGTLTITAPGGGFATSSNFVVQPTITTFSPAFGAAGTNVTINGANFNVGTPVVKFNGITSASVTGVSFGQLNATVPNAATTGPITVTTTDGTATSLTLFYLPPFIKSFSPTNSAPGTTVTILGTNFTDASSVSFNGTPATFTVTNNNIIGAIVPGGFTTGPISVTTPAGTTNTSSLAASNFFAAPIISSFTPTHGLPGTNVTIFGSSFLGTSAVRFQAGGGGTTNASILSVANGQLVVRVPTNAITGPITVVAPAGTNTSSGTFFLDYAELLVTVTDDPDPVTVGSNLVYTILVKNFGPFPSTVTLTNVLPPSVTFVSSTLGTTVSNVTTANLGTINVNATVLVTITGTPNTPGLTITNLTTAVTGPLATLVTTTTYVEPLPLLSVSFNPPSTVLLSWPSALSNFTLQFNPSLPGTNWSNVLTAPVSGGGSNVVTQTNLGPARYYRLKR